MPEEIKNDESKKLTNLIKSYLNNEFSKSFSLAGSFIRDYPNNFEGYNLLALSSKALGKFSLGTLSRPRTASRPRRKITRSA